ncbi:nucleotidyltransferase domain-containing protein [Kordia sp.]|uniref:nucleotidyltransferase domain-containing protein n=1 Tax=Kordia sp. TaxID=1965332 RepID=UPI0025BF8328|nr:nucleotidyltransferase domain-containing protein [Kordia sp.]MCH2195284.1 nucleotidyltransferase domain-containing protein [Kordia sp.]
MSALKTILYFSLFKYPLTRTEIFQFSENTDQKEVDSEIDLLLKKGIIFNFDGFYIDVNNPDRVERRLKGNEMARNIMPKAIKVSRKIAKFPYVKGVCLSGALSKGYYDDDGDFDFFIITKPKRLWIARTILVLYKKIFLFNSKKYFCVNYFISSDQLEIAEQNLFTATEIATLIPLYGKDTFVDFLAANPWAKPYFPNKPTPKTSTIRETEKTWFSKLIQKVFDGSVGLKLDRYLQKLTIKKWQRKFTHLAQEDFNVAMKSTRHVSKHHPQNYQNKVTTRLKERYNQVIEEYDLQYPKYSEKHA